MPERLKEKPLFQRPPGDICREGVSIRDLSGVRAETPLGRLDGLVRALESTDATIRALLEDDRGPYTKQLFEDRAQLVWLIERVVLPDEDEEGEA
jgi:hypothetical protein